jgi:hypothetical protein
MTKRKAADESGSGAKGERKGKSVERTSLPVLRGQFRQITEILQGATEKQLGSLLKQLLDGKRKIAPDIELSELEAGILIENLDAHVRERDQYHICDVIWDRPRHR